MSRPACPVGWWPPQHVRPRSQSLLDTSWQRDTRCGWGGMDLRCRGPGVITKVFIGGRQGVRERSGRTGAEVWGTGGDHEPGLWGL